MVSVRVDSVYFVERGDLKKGSNGVESVRNNSSPNMDDRESRRSRSVSVTSEGGSREACAVPVLSIAA